MSTSTTGAFGPVVVTAQAETGGPLGISFGTVAYIIGIALLGLVAITLVILAILMRRKDRRHMQRLQREAEERAAAAAAAHERFAAEQAERAAKLVVPVVIMQPDGTCLLAAELKSSEGSGDGGDSSPGDIEAGLAAKPATRAPAPPAALERTASGSHEPFYIESIAPEDAEAAALEAAASGSSNFALETAASRSSDAPLVGARSGARWHTPGEA